MQENRSVSMEMTKRGGMRRETSVLLSFLGLSVNQTDALLDSFVIREEKQKCSGLVFSRTLRLQPPAASPLPLLS